MAEALQRRRHHPIVSRQVCFALLFASLFLVAQPARALIVTYRFSGVITHASDFFSGLEDSVFTGILTYDTEVEFYLPPYDPIFGLDITIGTMDFFTPEDRVFRLSVTNDRRLYGDYFTVSGGAGIGLVLADSTGQVFSDTSLPASLSLGDFDFAGISSKIVADGFTKLVLTGSVESLVTVPEPTTAGLWLVGLLILGTRLRSHRRTPRPPCRRAPRADPYESASIRSIGRSAATRVASGTVTSGVRSRRQR